MAFQLRLPYYDVDFRSPLPTKADIAAATPMKEINSTTKVANVNNQFVVKYGPQVDPIEAENLIYVRRTTQVPVPRVYAVFNDAEEQFIYIIMEYVSGRTLHSAWSEMTSAQKHKVAGTLKSYLDELRAIPSPGYYGSIGKRPLLESMFWTPGERIPTISGPFKTEAEFNEAMAQKYIHFGAPRFKADFYRRAFSTVLSGHPPAFTHADFQRKNIMIDVCTESGDAIRITIIDWEKSGWYPSYWEYSMATFTDRFNDDWNEWLDQILEPHYIEYPYLQMLYLDLWS